jgi:hypothetical protein
MTKELLFFYLKKKLKLNLRNLPLMISLTAFVFDILVATVSKTIDELISTYMVYKLL